MIVRPDAPPLTVKHYRNLPETGPRYQLIDGDLYTAPAPSRFHQDISRNLEFILLRYLANNPLLNRGRGRDGARPYRLDAKIASSGRRRHRHNFVRIVTL